MIYLDTSARTFRADSIYSYAVLATLWLWIRLDIFPSYTVSAMLWLVAMLGWWGWSNSRRAVQILIRYAPLCHIWKNQNTRRRRPESKYRAINYYANYHLVLLEVLLCNSVFKIIPIFPDTTLKALVIYNHSTCLLTKHTCVFFFFSYDVRPEDASIKQRAHEATKTPVLLKY